MYAEDYIQNDVTANDPVELVCLLYAKAIERLNLVQTRLGEGNSAGCSEAIARAMEIVLELIGSLDIEKGGEIAQSLAALYLFVQEQLAEASTEQKAKPIDNAVGVLTTLLEGWKDCRSALPDLNLTIVGAGAATISAQTNRTSLSNSLSGLVANYNILVDAVQSQIGESAGALSGNVTVRQAQQVLRLATSFLGSGTIKSMVEVGLELDNKGKLSFNALTFNLLTDSQVTDAITFIGDTSTGFAGNAATLLDSLGDPVNGQIQAAIASLQDSDTKLTGEIEEAQERVDALIANLEARFAAADVLLSQLEAQQSLLTTLLAPPESLNI